MNHSEDYNVGDDEDGGICQEELYTVNGNQPKKEMYALVWQS